MNLFDLFDNGRKGINEGHKVVPGIDRERYTDLSHEGLEGPFRLASGKVVYYDPQAGQYYDRDSDMYMSHDDYAQHNQELDEKLGVKLSNPLVNRRQAHAYITKFKKPKFEEEGVDEAKRLSASDKLQRAIAREREKSLNEPKSWEDRKYDAAMQSMNDYIARSSSTDSNKDVNEAPGAETLAHNQKTAKSNLAAFDLAEGMSEVERLQTDLWEIFKAVTGRRPRAGVVDWTEEQWNDPEWLNQTISHYYRQLPKDIDEHGGGVNNNGSYIAWRKKANKEHGITPAPKTVEEWQDSAAGEPDQTHLTKVVSKKKSVNNEGIRDLFKSAAGKVGKWFKGDEPDFSYDDPDSPMNWMSREIGKRPAPVGKSDNAIDWTASQLGKQAPVRNKSSSSINWTANQLGQTPRSEPVVPVKQRTGGRVAGQLSQTPNAIRKRNARAAARTPQEEAANPSHQRGPKSMQQAAGGPTGPKFGGYLKGTDPAPTEYSKKGFGGCESEEMEEGIAGNMKVRSDAIKGPKVPTPANLVAKHSPTAGAGKHANNLKKAQAQSRYAKHKGRNFDMMEGGNFLTWAVAQGYDVIGNPVVYESAKIEYNKNKFPDALCPEIIAVFEDHATEVRKYLLRNKNLYENRQDYQTMIDFLDNLDTDNPVVGEDYVYASILTTPIAGINSISYFTRPHKLEGIKNNKAYFNINGKTKGYPETGSTKGDTFTHTYFFKSSQDFENFILMFKLKFGEQRTFYKSLDSIQNEDNIQVMHHETYYGGLDEKAGSDLQPGQYWVWTVYFDDGSSKRIKVDKEDFDPKAYYAKQNRVVVNVDYSWEPHNG